MKFIIDHIFLFAIVILSGGALLWPLLSMRGKRASVLVVSQLINRGKTIIVDVRTPEEFAKGSLPDAKHIPLPELEKRVAELEKFKTRPIVVVCQKGSRSASAVAVLTKAGFAEATSLDGGIDEWTKQGLPLKSPSPAKPSLVKSLAK